MMLTRSVLIIYAALTMSASAVAAEPVHVYGPGGPLPAVQEAAAAFKARHGVDIQVTAGPTPKWLNQAKSDADVIFSGSESMMTDFVTALGGQIDVKTITPLYLRPSAILVRPGNPGHIGGIADLLKPRHKILVVNGSGQGGLWEDVVGRLGDIAKVKAFRANIGQFAATSADAKQVWITDPSYDAWLIWNIWQVANPAITEQVPVEPDYRVYRDTGVALTQRGNTHPDAQAFAAFLASPDGAKIFTKWGWVLPDAEK